ncbi:hypothetical protein [Roseimicrobium sp. ORNL1]|uniref:hypothetical protein n=1 Tax=Roseimicrobium sp. ORNL1 TaxID=2711231 RepID=UPI0013E18DDE|nr:hypothetical protein [Roseimicrobium sp. ORNL1]QIF00797.1 hypothetical protein G5S37_04410 [Roseimicrobium sp. ORNL1]
MFYPTASHVYRLGLARTKKERINVIIGGSSVLNGTGQAANELWTDKLSELLGPDYRVLNLGFRAAAPGEFGAIGAEMLLDRRRVIFVSIIYPAGVAGQPDGVFFRYFFWDAWYKGLIDRNLPDRAASVAGLDKKRESDPKYFELRRGAWLNAHLFFNDWWNTLVYTKGGTVWNLVTQSDSFSPRIQFEDLEPAAAPLDQRLEAVRQNLAVNPYKGKILKMPLKKDADGEWIPDAKWFGGWSGEMKYIFPNEVLRQRTIVVVHRPHALAFEGMTEDELGCWSALSSLTARVVEENGMRSFDMGFMSEPDDFNDLIHLSGKGGERLAMQLAPDIRKLAKDLGYTEPGAETRSSSSKNKKKK